MLPAPDKSPRRARLITVAICLAWSGLLCSCNRMATPPARQGQKDAEAKTASGDYLEAISLYERSLDGTASSADIHYRIALLYDDKMNEPLHALHHFKRYLTLAPAGAHASEVKNFMKRDELALVTSLSGDSVVSRAEAARLKNENLNLRKELDAKIAEAKSAAAAEKSAAHSSRAKPSPHPKKAASRRSARD